MWLEQKFYVYDSFQVDLRRIIYAQDKISLIQQRMVY